MLHKITGYTCLWQPRSMTSTLVIFYARVPLWGSSQWYCSQYPRLAVPTFFLFWHCK